MKNQKRDDSAFQRFKAPIIPLGTTSATGEAVLGAFRVPIPDSRLRVKVTIWFQAAAGAAARAGGIQNATLWMYEAEFDDSGVSGKTVPCADVEGTKAAPTTIPLSTGLYGYSREFTTLADYVEGVVDMDSNGTQAGTWVMQATYCPDSVRFTPNEWDEITRKCNPERTSGPALSS